jgi:4-hydroxy-3-methylbut-2-enyl diphosphate reductase
VVFALGIEFARWRRRTPFRLTQSAGRSAHEAEIGGAHVRVATCGMGAPHVRAALDAAGANRADAIVMAGIAGGLKPQYASGQILAARHVRPVDGGPRVAADRELLALAAACGAIIVESFVSVDRIVARAEDKQRLGADDDAVDMESAAVLAEACARGVRSVAVRVVGDTVSEDLPIDVGWAMPRRGATGFARLLVEVLRRPDRWPAQVRFGLAQRRALKRLTTFLDCFIGLLGSTRPQGGPFEPVGTANPQD